MHRRGIQLLLSLVILGSFFVSNTVFTKVLISKIQISGETSTDEYVELYNYSSSSLPLSNWRLVKLTSGGSENILVSSFPDGLIINPFSYFLIAHRDLSSSTTADLFYSNSSYSLASNNSLLLIDSDGLEIDQLSWGDTTSTSGSTATNPQPGESLARLPNNDQGNFQDSNDSSSDFIISTDQPFNSASAARPVFNFPQNEESIVPEENHFEMIKINEILPNPNEGDEWIELFNTSSSTVKISRGTLCDSRSGDCVISELEGEILPASWKVINLSGSKLNNDGDAVILKDKNGQTIDMITYGNGKPLPKKGQSLARTMDGFDTNEESNWAISTSLTPGEANVIMSPPQPIPSVGGTYIPSEPENKISKPKTISKEQTISFAWNTQIPSVLNLNFPNEFDAHLTADPRGGHIFFIWNFGDGQTIEGSRVTHTFATSGIFTIHLSGTSTQGTTGSKSWIIKVADPQTIPSGIFFNGILPNPATGEEEWISIGNNSTTSIDLSGWILKVSDKKYVIPPKTAIKPEGTLKFYRSATHLVFNNEGGSIFLYNQTEKLVDILSFEKLKRGQQFFYDGSNWEKWPEDEPEEKVLGIKVAATEPKKTSKYRYLAISDAKTVSQNSSVIVTGKVQSLPNSPASNYFYIADESGGIQIYSFKKLFPKLSLGDTIRVYGEIGSSQGQNRIKTKLASAITKTASGDIPKGVLKKIEEIENEDYGTLIKLNGEITSMKSSYFFIDDDSGEAMVSISSKSGIDKTLLQLGDFIEVTGIIEPSGDSWKITPRSTSDLQINKIVKEESQPTTNYKWVWTGSGLTLIVLAGGIKKWIIK